MHHPDLLVDFDKSSDRYWIKLISGASGYHGSAYSCSLMVGTLHLQTIPLQSQDMT
mgnify:CR=1